MHPFAVLAVTTPSDREIVVTRFVKAPPALVFECFVRPDLLKRWYGLPDWEMTVCEMDARAGGKWRFVTVSPDGYAMGSGGLVKSVDRPNSIVTSETYDDDWTGGETVNRVDFTADGDGTLVVTTVLYASKAGRDGALATPMAVGMEIGYKRLDQVLAEQ